MPVVGTLSSPQHWRELFESRAQQEALPQERPLKPVDVGASTVMRLAAFPIQVMLESAFNMQAASVLVARSTSK